MSSTFRDLVCFFFKIGWFGHHAMPLAVEQGLLRLDVLVHFRHLLAAKRAFHVATPAEFG
ncbi:MAG TPA: hypothetical protein VJZ03_01235 [Candidatus Bathyarchaeia archaeon]|nr:hypothetical protein [Candidatus Bathyarchaeia archaeon]